MASESQRRANARWKAKNPEKLREYARTAYQKRKAAGLIKRGSPRTTVRERGHVKRALQRLRDELFEHYGLICRCCGETTRAFLVLDHIKGGGRAHKRESGGTLKMLRDIRRRGFPMDEFQILCANCNMAKESPDGCPHQLK